MDGFWLEILRLMGTDEFKITLLFSVPAVLLFVFKPFGKLTSYLRSRAYKGYAASTSFSRQEIAIALDGYVQQEGMRSDPSTRMELGEALAAQRTSAFRMLDNFIVGLNGGRHLFVFADCGMGKTTLLINYFHRRQRWLRRRKTSIVLISLSKDSYLDEIGAVPPDKRAETVILMDAFDEDPLVFEGVQKRLDLLVRMTSGFKAVVISCRSQFFADDSEIPVATGELRAGPTPSGTSKEYEFERIYLAPFDRKKVAQYLRRAFPGVQGVYRRRMARRLVDRFPSLIMRPMLLAHISEVLENDDNSSLISQAEIYQAIVSGWAKREAHWVPTQALLTFSKRFALNVFEMRRGRGGEYSSKEELTALAESWGIQVRPELLTGRSLLNRTEDGKCKFAHRSIMEYFVSEGILDGTSSSSLDVTGQIAMFLFERLGVDAASLLSKLDVKSKIVLVDAEARLGYATNYSLLYEDAVELDPTFVYGLPILNELGEPHSLGEHLQSMIAAIADGGSPQEVRICTSDDGPVLRGYVSIWAPHKAALSRINIRSEDWAAMIGRKWSARRFCNVVGRFQGGRSSAEHISYRVGTFCNLAEDSLGVDSATGCRTLAAELNEFGEGVTLRMIAGFIDSGPLAVFGILRGGSLSLVSKRKFSLLTKRLWQQDEAALPGRAVAQEQPLIPASERWQVRDRR